MVTRAALTLLTRPRAFPWIAAGVAIALYAGSLANGFAFDDVRIIEGNSALHSLRTLPAALLDPYWRGTGEVYRPLPLITYAIDWWLTGGAPWFMHAMNVAWHALVTLLVVRLALRGSSARVALLAGLIFAAHPVHVEAVANIVGRAELICAAMLAGVALVVTHPDERKRRRWGLLALLSALALASKEIGFIAPLIAGAGALATTRSRREALRALAAAALGLVPILTVRYHVLGSVTGISEHPAFVAASNVQGTALALSTYPQVLALVTLPLPPVPDYSPTLADVLAPNAGLVTIGVILVAAALVMAVRHVRSPTFLGFAVLAGVAAYAPVSNLFLRTATVIAERTLYSASIAAAILMAVALERMASRPRLGMLACWLLTGAWTTVNTIPAWRDSDAVVALLRERAPRSYVTHVLAAHERRHFGDTAGVRRELATALELFDRDARLLTEAAAEALRAGDAHRARTLLTKAVVVDPEDLYARAMLIELTLSHGDPNAAARLAGDGLESHPDQRRWRALADSLRSAR
ncbi:MAG TPA: tetratricopeptide repeat protein [Gemmatimonadaceae bacterium]|nr:tetratricopeptide repeat protein [Gemmatimonadaceae bacterium]